MLSALIATFMVMPQPVMARGEWLTDFEKAKRYSSASGKPILANFTGSDWCPFCLRLKREVFDTDLFKDWAFDHVVLFEADYPRKKVLPAKLMEQNEFLVREYSIGGYPSILFLSGQGDLLGKSGFLETGGPVYWTKVAEKQIADGKNEIATSDGIPEIIGKPLSAKDLRGEPFPELKIGSVVTGKLPKELKGKTILLDFWATWCGPCVQEMPKLNRWQREFGDDLVIIGISDEPAEKISTFASRNGIEYVLTSDETHQLASELEIQTLPQLVLISGDGIVRWQGGIGDEDPLTSARIRRLIDATRNSN
ncbi:MAG: TlpA family protein disulfide reductase [Fimbriimonadaceae bacterium]